MPDRRGRVIHRGAGSERCLAFIWQTVLEGERPFTFENGSREEAMRGPAPLELVVPGLRGRVLTALVRSSDPLSIRQVARIARSTSPAGVQRALQALVEDGLARLAFTSANGHFFELRRGSPIARALRALDEARDEIPDAIGEHVAGWLPQPRGVVLFGPHARGEDAERIDLLIVWEQARVEPWAREQLLLRFAVESVAGLPLAVTEWLADDWDDACRSRDAFALEIALEGIRLQGLDLPQLTRGVRYR